MPNYLKMPKKSQVLALLELGCSYRRIEAETGVHRETVSGYDAARPAFRHVSIDLSWGPVIAPYVIDGPAHLKMTAALIRKYPDRFIYGSDQGATADWNAVKSSYEAWRPLWQELGPALTRRVTRENYLQVFDESRKNMRNWERAHPGQIE